MYFIEFCSRSWSARLDAMRTGSPATLRLVLQLVSRLQCKSSVRCSRIQRPVGLIRFLVPLLCLAASSISFSLTQLRLELEIFVSHVSFLALCPWTLYAVVYTISCPHLVLRTASFILLSPRAFAPLYLFSSLRQIGNAMSILNGFLTIRP